MAKLNLLIDLERCIGCKSCEAACKQVNGLGPYEYRNRVQWLGDPGAPELDFLTVTCQQCDRPACLRACPVSPKAISKDPDTGVVSVNEGSCTGCGECVTACPYGAMGYDPVGHHAVKCDLCESRRAVGDGPACVSVCPTEALRFGEHDALLAEAHNAGRKVRDHDQFLQGPRTIILDRLTREATTLLEPNETEPSPAQTPTAPARSDAIAGRRIPLVQDDARRREPLAKVHLHKPYGSPAPNQAPRTELAGACNICFNGCPVKYQLQGNEVVGVLGNDEDPIFAGRICPKSQMTLQMYANDERLTQPLRRVGPRGTNRFEPVSWETALDEIAERLGKVAERYGREALGIYLGTRTGVMTIMGHARMFQKLWGTPNMYTTQILCDESKVEALKRIQGSTNLPNIYTKEDIGSAALHVYIGDNQAETRPVNFGLVNSWRLAQGARMITVDPRMTVTASKSDRWLPIHPGTDMALGLALIHAIFEANQQDEAFCNAWVEGWEHWREHVRKQGYSPEWAASITGLEANEIRSLANEIASADGCMLYASRGINQHTNGTQTNRVLMFLAAMTGNWGRRGGGFMNVAAEPDWGEMPVPPERMQTSEQPAIPNGIPGWQQAAIEASPYPLRALITSNNPVGQWPNEQRTREALMAMDLVVHIELFKNATSAEADYVLPAASGIEKGGITRLAEDRRIGWNEAAITPPGEAKTDHWIWIELGRRFGFDDVLSPRYADPAIFWDEIFRKATPDIAGVTVERLRSQPHRWVRVPLRNEGDPEAGTLYLPGTTAAGSTEGHRFPTVSGRLEFWTPAQEKELQAFGVSALPEHSSDRDLTPANDLDLDLVTGRPPAPHFHSWTHYFWQAQEMWPDLYCQIHPTQADSAGIADGDRVAIENHQSRVEARAWVTHGIRPGTLFMPIGWGENQPWYESCSVNRLTGDKTDPIAHQSNLKSNRVRLIRL